MKYFEEFSSNTVAASANQHWFSMEGEAPRTSRVFYRIQAGGRYLYSFLFSNLIDSTYADGKLSHKNLVLPPWRIHAARAGRCTSLPQGEPKTWDEREIPVADWQTLRFEGKEEKTVAPGEFFTTDPVELSFRAGEYLCLELCYSGKKLPYHEESLLPIFQKTPSGWCYDRKMPLPGMVGCQRKTKKRVVFLGDSITQGIGAPYNSYLHWNARLSEALGEEYSFWNLGIGYARADDAASDGAWLFKAKHADLAIVCLGVNDILRGFSAEAITKNLDTVILALRSCGAEVVVQTVPPFDYGPAHREVWERTNAHLWEKWGGELPIFDTGTILSKSKEEPHLAPYGGHPNPEGCKAWADALYVFLKEKGIL